MDILIIAALVGALVVASDIWGYDSREKLRSEEQMLAAWGVTWDALDTVASPPSWGATRRRS